MNVLIVKTYSLSDVIRVLPAIADATKAIPGISFDWVVDEKFDEIPKWHSSVKNVIPVAWRRWRKNIIKALYSGELQAFLKTLRKKKYDLIIDAQGLIESSVIAKIARGTSNGYDKNSAREKQSAFFYKKTFAISLNKHSITRIRLLFAAALKYKMPITIPDYSINKQIFPKPHYNEKYIVLCHGTTSAERCWREQKWAELAQFATTNGFIVYLPWENHVELERVKRIAKNNSKAKVLPKLSLSAIATLLQSAKCVVAVDAGLGHIAAAFEAPIVSLYGQTIPRLEGTAGLNQNRITHMTNFDKLEAADVWQAIKKNLEMDGH